MALDTLTRQQAHAIATRVVRLSSVVGSYLFGTGISILLGFTPLPAPQWMSLRAALSQNAVAVGLLVAAIVLVLVGSYYITERLGERRHLSASIWRRLGGFLIASAIETIIGLLIGVLAGFNSLPASNPLFMTFERAPRLTLVVIAFLLAAIIFSPLYAVAGNQPPETPRQRSRLYTSIWISCTSSLCFIVLLSVVLLRPSWCPTSICPPAQKIVVTNPKGVHDANMEAFLTTVQSSAFMLTNPPASYSLASLPSDISAVNLSAPSVYRVVVGVHNLKQGTPYSIILDEVALVVDDVQPVPVPLRVWEKGLALQYTSEPYLATYNGDLVGAPLLATYTRVPGAHVQLASGESDELDIQLTARHPAKVIFHVQITYHLANETAHHQLVLPQKLSIVFSDNANWHAYTLQAGVLVPAK